jgi:putative membrane protein
VPPLYLTFKYLHILSVIGWVSSTLSLGIYLLYKTLYKKDLKNQEEIRSFYRFLTIFELLFFGLVLLFGLLMVGVYGLDITKRWVFYKVLIAFGLFLPLEVVNGVLIFKFVKNEKWYFIYDKFIIFISPALIVAGLVVIYLAVFKPV